MTRKNRIGRKNVELCAGSDADETAVAGLAIEQLIQIFRQDGRRVGQPDNTRCMRRLDAEVATAVPVCIVAVIRSAIKALAFAQ